MTPKQTRAQQVTLALSVVLAVSLGVIIYFAVTSLPYLAVSPSTDPRFGALNSCLLPAVPERVGFAVARDATKAAAFSTSKLVECAGTPTVATTFERPGVTLAAYDGSGALWVATREALFKSEHGAWVEHGRFAASALVGAAFGVVALQDDGTLVAVKDDGSVTATRQLPAARGVKLAANADGALVAVWGGGKLSIINSVTLEPTRAEVACAVREVWWRPEPQLFVAECFDMTFEVNAFTSESALLQARRRTPSTLVGATGDYVTGCDVLPCSVEAPR